MSSRKEVALQQACSSMVTSSQAHQERSECGEALSASRAQCNAVAEMTNGFLVPPKEDLGNNTSGKKNRWFAHGLPNRHIAEASSGHLTSCVAQSSKAYLPGTSGVLLSWSKYSYLSD